VLRHALAFCVLPVLLALAPAALGQGDDEAICADRGSPLPPDQVMAACNRLVADTHQRDSARARAFVGRGTANLKAKQPDAALADFSQAVALDGDNFEAHFLRAQVHFEKKEYPAALEDFGAAEKLQPRNMAVHLQRSILYLDMKRYGEAIADADFAAGGGAALLNQRCWARAVAGTELDKARTACDQALWAAPDNPAILDSRGVVGLKQLRFADAWDDYNTVLKAQPRNARALYGRGLAAIGLNREADGKADIALANRLNGEIAAAYRDIGLSPP
jgi:tetratricopeptide (TPR) repeat protein